MSKWNLKEGEEKGNKGKQINDPTGAGSECGLETDGVVRTEEDRRKLIGCLDYCSPSLHSMWAMKQVETFYKTDLKIVLVQHKEKYY